MREFHDRGAAIRESAKALVLEFLAHHTDASPVGLVSCHT
jgi:hypothetical protein